MPLIPIDTTTGQQSGDPVHSGHVEIVVGYLVTHPDGYGALIRGDRTRAENYAITHHAVAIEPVFIRRSQ